MPTSRLEIDLSSIDRNLGVVREVVTSTPPAKTDPQKTEAVNGNGDAARPRGTTPVGICAVVKQDGYGLGAARISKRLCASGVQMLAVYTMDEARALAEAVANVPILVLMPVGGVDRMDPLYRHAASGRLHLTLHSNDQLRSLADNAARIGTPLSVHVQMDTGLSRGGALGEDAKNLVTRVLASARIRLCGLMTHFASPCCEEGFTREQARGFREFVEAIKPAIKASLANARGSGGGTGGGNGRDLVLHAANSCATFRSRSLHGSMVRVGQALLGYTLDDVEDAGSFEFAAAAKSLEPSVRWTSTVVHSVEVPGGWPVGYGSTWRAPERADGRKTRIALIPVGYADGYPRSLGGERRKKNDPRQAFVGLTGRSWERRGSAEAEVRPDGPGMPTVYAPVVGRVSMDQITVDVTDVPERYLKPAARPGIEPAPEVEVYSRVRGTPNYLPALAASAGTITHELLTRISARVERVYTYPARPVAPLEPARGGVVVRTLAALSTASPAQR